MIILQARQEFSTMGGGGMDLLHWGIVENEGPFENANIRKLGRDKSGHLEQQRGRHTSDAGCGE